MRSQLSSTTDSRKSRRRFLLLLVGITTALPLAAQVEHETTLSTDSDYLTVAIGVSGAEPETLFANLADGLTARLEFAIRILESRRGPLAIFGSRMINEFRIVYDARYDPFRERFTITTQDGAFFTFRDEASVWSFFFSLPDYRIPWSAIDLPVGRRRDDLIVESRVTYDPVVFAPGLSILSVLLPSSRHQSPWSATSLEVGR